MHIFEYISDYFWKLYHWVCGESIVRAGVKCVHSLWKMCRAADRETKGFEGCGVRAGLNPRLWLKTFVII